MFCLLRPAFNTQPCMLIFSKASFQYTTFSLTCSCRPDTCCPCTATPPQITSCDGGGHHLAATGAKPYHLLSPLPQLAAQARASPCKEPQFPGSSLPCLCKPSSHRYNTLHSPVPALPLCLQLMLPTANDLHGGCQAV